MLNSSFINVPLMQDQDIIEITCPLPIDEAIYSDPTKKKVFGAKRYFPTSAMYNRQNNF